MCAIATKSPRNYSSSNPEGRTIEDLTWVCRFCRWRTRLEEFYCRNERCYNSWNYCMS